MASIDPVQEGFDDFRTTKSLRVTGYLAPQHGQIMVVTEDISEFFRSLRQRSEDTRLHGPQQLQLMAKILNLFAQLVQVLDCGLLARDGQRSSTPAIDSPHPLTDTGPAVMHVGPVVEALER